MAKELRDTARTVEGTSGVRFDIASAQRAIARWESPTGSVPGHRYQQLLARLFAYTPTGAVALGPGSDFDTLLVALRHFGVPAERIQQIMTLVTSTIGAQHETTIDNDRASPERARVDLERLTPLLSAVLRTHGDVHTHGLSLERAAAQNEMFLPVVVKGRLVAVPFGGVTEDDDTMSPLNRRSVISCGLTAAAAAALSTSDAAGVIRRLATAPTFGGQCAGESWAAAIYDTVLNPTEAVRRVAGADGDIPYAGRLRPLVDQAMRTSLTSDYGTLEKSLPALIGQAEAATMQRGDDDRVAQQALSDVYSVVGWTLIKADMPIGAGIAAQRAIDAAERAGDIPRLAAATRCLSEVHMRAGDLEAATRTALLAAVHLDRTRSNHRPRNLLLRGAALLSAAAASARRGDRREARTALKAAAACAEDLGHDRVFRGTVFGPTNVAIHEVAIAIELGDASEAVRRIPTVRLEQMPKTLTERRGRFLIDVARSYAQMRDDQAAIDALVESEKIAPDELRNHRLTRELVPQLLTREHRSSDLRALARRCNLLS